MSNSENFVFRLNFLLGASSQELKKDFSDDFVKSEDLKLFENYKDAFKLRNLCLLRQCFLHNINLFEDNQYNVKKLLKVIPNLKCLLEDLKKEDIDFEDIFHLVIVGKLYSYDIFNILNKMISIIEYKVLFDLDIGFADELSTYFYFPDVSSMSELINMVQSLEKLKNPYNLYIYNGEKIKNTLKYALHNDLNCLRSVFSMLSLPYNKDIVVAPFEFRNVMGEDPDKFAVIVQKDIVTEFIRDTVKAEAQVKKPEEIIERIREDSVVELFTENICSNIFVDCENMSFLSVLSFIDSLNSEEIKGITFIKNEDANNIWSLFDVFNIKKVPFKVILVKKVLDKNCSGVVLASEITKSVSLGNTSDIYILSNNPDISILIPLLNSVKSHIVYSSKFISNRYLEYLNKNDFNIIDMEKEYHEDKILNKILVVLILGRLKELKISDWNLSNLADYIIDIMFTELDMMNKVELKNHIVEIFKEVTTEIKENTVYLRWKDIMV